MKIVNNFEDQIKSIGTIFLFLIIYKYINSIYKNKYNPLWENQFSTD